MKRLIHFLKKLDHFGIQRSFRVNAHEKYKSAYGGFAFCGYLIFSVIFILYYFKCYVSKENKNVIDSDQMLVPAPEINMTERHLSIAFALQFENGTMASDLLDQYLDITLNYVIIRQGKKEKTRIKMKKCGYSDLPTDNVTFETYHIGEYYCLERYNYSLEGMYVDPEFKYLEYTISLKEKVLADKKLYERIYSIMLNMPIKVNSYFSDLSLNVNNLTTPIEFCFNSITNYLRLDSFQKQNLDFMILNYTDDTSIIFSEPQTSVFAKFYSLFIYSYEINNRFNSTNSDKLNLARIYVRSSQISKNVRREFQKLSNFLANISGVISNLLVLLFVIIRFVNEFKLKQSLINKVFNFKDHLILNDPIMEKIHHILSEPTHNIFINQKQSPTSNSEGINTFIKIFKSIKKIKVLHPKFKEHLPEDKFNYKYALDDNNFLSDDEFAMKRGHNKPLQFTICELLYSLFSCSPNYLKTRKIIYKKAKHKLNYYLDILTLVKKFQEFDIMKALIFSKEQQCMLNFLSKPIASIAEPVRKSDESEGSLSMSQNIELTEIHDHTQLILRDSQVTEEDLSNLYASWMSLKQNGNLLSDLDMNLMKRIEEKLKCLFHEEHK